MSDTVKNVTVLPAGAREINVLYESQAVNQFVLHGNVNDRLYLPLGAQLRTAIEFFTRYFRFTANLARVGSIHIPQPAVGELQSTLALLESEFPEALAEFKGNSPLLVGKVSAIVKALISSKNSCF